MKWWWLLGALVVSPVLADWLEQRQAELLFARERLQQMADEGPWPVLEEQSLKLDMSSPNVALLREQLVRTGDLHDIALDPNLFDEPLLEAVKAFQRRHGLNDDGVVGPKTRKALNTSPWGWIRQVDATMDRMAAFEAQPEQLVINVPAFELQWWRYDQLVLNSRIIVGRPSRPTPLLQSQITRVEFNPPWNVPYSIFRKDYRQRLRWDPDLLRRKRFDIVSGYGRNARVIPVPAVLPDPWPRGWRLRQRPGRNNALGLIKFVMPNDEAIYLHHTNQPSLFEKDQRAFSSGCIRVEAAFELAGTLLADQPQWQDLLNSGRHLGLEVANPLPVTMVYWTAWVDSLGQLQLRDDLYGWDSSHFAQVDH